MKNRSIILTTILSLFVCGGLSSTALAENPAAVRDVDNPARQAVQQSVTITMPPNSQEASASITIPAGKIFVLETVSFQADGNYVRSIKLVVTGPLITGGSGRVPYALVIPPPITISNALLESNGSQALRLYVQPGANLEVHFITTSFNPPDLGQGVQVSLSGYFVNAQ